MHTSVQTSPLASVHPVLSGSKAKQWTGRILSGLAIAFLLFDAIGKLLVVQAVVDGSAELGFPASTMLPIGLVLLACVIVYAIPASAPLGAILLTGYLGGAIATHVRVGNPLFSHTLFPIYVAAIIWGGLFLRDSRVRALLQSRPHG